MTKKNGKKGWVMSWVTFIPNKGHVYTEYRDGRAIFIAGARVARESN